MNLRGLRITTRCATVEQFVATFNRFCEGVTVFVSHGRRPIGAITAFSFDLSDGTPVLSGLGAVLEEMTTSDNRFGHPGIVIALHKLPSASKRVFERMTAARAIAEQEQKLAEQRALSRLARVRAVTSAIGLVDIDALTPPPSIPAPPATSRAATAPFASALTRSEEPARAAMTASASEPAAASAVAVVVPRSNTLKIPAAARAPAAVVTTPMRVTRTQAYMSVRVPAVIEPMRGARPEATPVPQLEEPARSPHKARGTEPEFAVLTTPDTPPFDDEPSTREVTSTRDLASTVRELTGERDFAETTREMLSHEKMAERAPTEHDVAAPDDAIPEAIDAAADPTTEPVDVPTFGHAPPRRAPEPAVLEPQPRLEPRLADPGPVARVEPRPAPRVEPVPAEPEPAPLAPPPVHVPVTPARPTLQVRTSPEFLARRARRRGWLIACGALLLGLATGMGVAVKMRLSADDPAPAPRAARAPDKDVLTATPAARPAAAAPAQAATAPAAPTVATAPAAITTAPATPTVATAAAPTRPHPPTASRHVVAKPVPHPVRRPAVRKRIARPVCTSLDCI